MSILSPDPLRRWAGLSLFLLAAGAAQAGKTVINIPNGSFESQIVGSYTYEMPPNWTESTPNGTDSFTENISGFNATGTNHEGLASGGAIWQDLSTTLQPNMTYSLIVSVGNRDATWTTAGNASTFKLQLKNGVSITDLSSRTINAGAQVAPGTFRNFNTSYTVPLSAPAGTLRIRLQVDSADRAHFDNIQLVASFPETPYPGFTDSRQTPPTPQETVPPFDSRPLAESVIYLDFDGADIDPGWEWYRGLPFSVAHSGLSSFEILRACEAVKEDFLPFNISITTNSARYAAAPPGKRMRCIVTPTNHWLLEENGFQEYESAAGIAPSRIDEFATKSAFSWAGRFNTEPGWNSYNRDVPCFAFTKSWAATTLVDSGRDVAGLISHEVGHTLGLVHDSKSPSTEYYEGHGTFVKVRGPIASQNFIGVRLWAPLMGRYGMITQWSRGEYAGAYNWIIGLQDDVSIIANNGFGYAADDFGDTQATSVPVSTGGNSIIANGVIGRTASGELDEDWLQFTLPSRALVRFVVKPAEPFSDPNANVQMDKNLGIANLCARLNVRRANGSVLVGANPTNDVTIPDPATDAERLKLADALRTKLDVVLDAGTWYLQLSGAGFADPASTGYSDYGSMGAWNLDGSIFYAPVITSPLAAGFTAGTTFNYSITATNSPTSFMAAGLPTGLSVNASGVISGNSTAVGTYNVTISATNGAGTDSRTLVLSVRPTVPDAVDAPELAFTYASSVPWFGQTAMSNDGIDAAQSGQIGHSQNSFMQTSVSGPGNLSFWWKVESEAGSDVLEVRIDGVLQTFISGTVNWVQKSYSIGAGTHFVSWTYQKDGSISSGADAGWVDQIVWTPAQAAPVITNPAAITWTVGSLISYPITATNSPTSYSLTGTLPPGLLYSGADHLIIGFPQRSGSWPVTLGATNAAGPGNKVLTITVESSFAKWARDRGLTGADAVPGADPDRDRRLNLFEMALNLNPILVEHDFDPVTANPVSGRLTATFSRVTSYRDILYEVQVSDDLKESWTTIARSIDGLPVTNLGAFSVSDSGGSVATVVVVDSARPPASARRYMRVKITQL